MGFEEFLDARLAALVRYATVLAGDPDRAADVVRRVLVKARKRWRRIGAMDAPESHVQRMITYECLSWRWRRPARAGPPDEGAARRIEEVDALRTALGTLPARQRVVLALRYHEGLTTAEIADSLGWPEGTVRSYAARALAGTAHDSRELLPAAFEQDAVAAPGTERVRQGFRHQAKAARKRRRIGRGAAGILAAGAVVAAALAALSDPSDSYPDQVREGSPLPPVPLLYRPTWLPAGLTEVARAAGDGTVGWEQDRIWSTRPLPARGSGETVRAPVVQLQIQPRDLNTTGPAGSMNVQVNDAQGRQWREADDTCTITWPAGPGKTLQTGARNTKDPCTTALRVARSVVQDNRTTFVPILRPTRPPAGMTVIYSELSKTAAGCRASLTMDDRGPAREMLFEIEENGGGLPNEGEPLRIAGRAAQYYPVAPKDAGWPLGAAVMVDLGSGRRLLVNSAYFAVPTMSKRALAEIAAAVEVGDIGTACRW